MTRLLAALVCLAALPLALAAPVPTHLFPKDPPLYYPVTKGARWVYLEDKVEHEYVVSEVEKTKEGASIVTVVEVEGEKRTFYRKMEVSRSGLLWLETTGGAAFDQPIRMLRCPVAANDNWPYRCSGPDNIATFEGGMKVIGTEQVEVPAGKFDAVRVKEQFTFGGDDLKDRCTFWYAPNIGVVKADYGNSTIVLKEFVPGK